MLEYWINSKFTFVQPVTSSLWGWQPSLDPLIALLQTQSNPFAMLLGCHTSRPNGNTRYQTTGTFSTSASTQTSPPSAGPSQIWSTFLSGRPSPWFMTTAQVSPYFFSSRAMSTCSCAYFYYSPGHQATNKHASRLHVPYARGQTACQPGDKLTGFQELHPTDTLEAMWPMCSASRPGILFDNI